MKKVLLLCLLVTPMQAWCQKPWKDALTGEASGAGLSIGKCNIGTITVKYKLGTFMGEPTVGSNIKWTKSYGTDASCLQTESFEIFVKGRIGSYTGSFLIEAGEGSIPKGDGNYGYNPLSGSPDWDALLIPYDYGGVKAFQSGRKYMPADQAKNIWKQGFVVTGVVFIDKKGVETTLR